MPFSPMSVPVVDALYEPGLGVGGLKRANSVFKNDKDERKGECGVYVPVFEHLSRVLRHFLGRLNT